MNELKLIIQEKSHNGILVFDEKGQHDMTRLKMELTAEPNLCDDEAPAALLSIKNVDHNDALYYGLEYVIHLTRDDLYDLKKIIDTIYNYR